ncbi:hypothetical protein HII31_09223 [Pseudocercospora fuligena]|uniref:Uncharacterized protein n=1 Tax=Pseudocercospora fuligena TaxID=685502 RepID=A0A8H6RE55_9PEZI|nr:hypothetical protein HII31_09223 [Pseudocercospora fuligena]
MRMYHRRQCACNDWGSYDHTSAAEHPSDCDVQTQIDDYMKRYLASTSISLPVDLVPMDKIVECATINRHVMRRGPL